MTFQTIGRTIKRWRQDRGLTQRALAERAGLHHVHIGRLERGEGNPTLVTLQTLAKVLRQPLGDLFTPRAKSRRPTSQRTRRH